MGYTAEPTRPLETILRCSQCEAYKPAPKEYCLCSRGRWPSHQEVTKGHTVTERTACPGHEACQSAHSASGDVWRTREDATGHIRDAPSTNDNYTGQSVLRCCHTCLVSTKEKPPLERYDCENNNSYLETKDQVGAAPGEPCGRGGRAGCGDHPCGDLNGNPLQGVSLSKTQQGHHTQLDIQ